MSPKMRRMSLFCLVANIFVCERGWQVSEDIYDECKEQGILNL